MALLMHDQNPYAASPLPSSSHPIATEGEWPAQQTGLWRDGDLLVAQRQTNFPPVCPVSNLDAPAKVLAYFPWARKDLYPMQFGAVVGVLYFLSQVKHTVLKVPVTVANAQSRFWRLLIGTVSGVAALALLGLLFYLTMTQAQLPRKAGQTFLERDGKVLAVTAATFACVVTMALVLHGMPDPTKKLLVHGVRGEYIWLQGAHADYLARLPRYEGERPEGTA